MSNEIDNKVTEKMNVIFKDKEQYDDFVSGKTHSDKGIRHENGSLVSQPDIDLIEDYEDNNSDELSEEVAQILIILGAVVGTYVVTKTAPIAKKWWNETALPNLKVKWSKLFGKNEVKESAENKINNVNFVDFSSKVDTVLNEYDLNVNSKETQIKVIAILEASILLVEQIRELKVESLEENAFNELEIVLEKVISPNFIEKLNHILEKDQSLNTFTANLKGGKYVNDKYVPISIDEIRTFITVKSA